MSNSNEMVKIAYDAMDDKLAKDIQILDIRNISVVADYFLICDGSNRNQVQAIADNVEEELHKAGYHVKSIEGYHTANWILMDFNDIIVHVFHKDDRAFYDLERIWKDGKVVNPEVLA
jgi:ribosome-associated protein